MSKTFVTELVVLAMYGELLQPPQPVCFLLPYSSLEELYMLLDEPAIGGTAEPEDQADMLASIQHLLQFLENPFVQKKIGRVLQIPWTVSHPIIYNEQVTFQFVNAQDTEFYGEEFDPIETELIEIAARHNVPLLIEDTSIHQRIIELELTVQVYDVADYVFALEEPLAADPYTDAYSQEGNALIPFILFGSVALIVIVSIISTLF